MRRTRRWGWVALDAAGGVLWWIVLMNVLALGMLGFGVATALYDELVRALNGGG